METGHDAKVRGSKQFEDSFGFVMLDEKQDRLVSLTSVPSVDLLGESLRLGLKIDVSRKLAARWRRDLQEYEALFPFRMNCQESVDRQHPIDDPFCVIEALDADAQTNVIRQAELGAHRRPTFSHGLLAGKRGRRPINRDRVGPHEGLVPSHRYRGMLAIDPALDESVDRVDEIVAVKLGVEAEHRAAENTRYVHIF